MTAPPDDLYQVRLELRKCCTDSPLVVGAAQLGGLHYLGDAGDVGAAFPEQAHDFVQRHIGIEVLDVRHPRN
ncbi:hypothetical protein [Nonomuraea sp. B19D2]|uniref:hypothetical protein n=1 Tax=Nonomuraea sp. B19D2 TaxID=3159561 RepID=UPI0032DB5307